MHPLIAPLVLLSSILGADGDLPAGIQPYDWALQQLHIPQAHETTRGSSDIIVAVIDLGYRHHPRLDGHLWTNPDPERGDIHGWDFHDDDASLEYTGPGEDSAYHRNHHVFVAGEVAAVAPECRIMVLRVGYRSHDSWHRAIRYAVDHGARVLVLPHGYIQRAEGSDVPLFYQGTDFAYPEEYPELREAYDYAYDQGCLIFKGTADNRGRRAVFAQAAWETLCAVGSLDRHDRPADITNSADYVEFAAPGGARGTNDPAESVWGCAAEDGYCAFQGGCMASGFAGGTAALIWSHFPDLTNDQLRQILRNTARQADGIEPDQNGWDNQTGFGILDAQAAVSLAADQLTRRVEWADPKATVTEDNGTWKLTGRLANRGVFDANQAIAVVYNGNPRKPASPAATVESPGPSLQVRQIGHVITPVRGLHETAITIELTEPPGESLWVETYSLDRHDPGHLHRTEVTLSQSAGE